MRKNNAFKECMSCTESMQGVHSYSIREECSACGGVSLVAEPKKEAKHLKETEAA